MAKTPDFRWELRGQDRPQLQLFDDGPQLRIGKGAYRGLEFLEVEARRIVNDIPEGAGLPFRHTINAYRGCSHACSYCLAGNTPILMGDGRTKPIAELRSGDIVYGTERVGAYRRYVHTEVTDHWKTMERAYRIVLEDSTSLVAGGGHRFLTNRGWKHVTGATAGPHQRPHLTTNNSLIGTGSFADGPGASPEYRRGYLCGMIRGDGHLGSYAYANGSRMSVVHRFRLALVDLEALRRTADYLAIEDVATTEFLFQEAAGERKAIRAIRTSAKRNVMTISELIGWPDEPSMDWRKGFLAGIFDAEGSYSDGALRITNSDDAILTRIGSCLTALGFRYRNEPKRPNGVGVVRLLGGLPEHLRFFHVSDPAITRKRSIVGKALKSQASLGIVVIEPLGFELPMFDISTGTGDFIANGVVSHNCFARPTHEYLNLDSGRDFETKIVVKVNAVDLVRAETHPSRWGGELIAMGTNTDPYQPAEGKYRLTQGIVEVLGERANPFSILTKSSLVLRDLDLLADVARRAAIHVDFSIGTLDDDVWRTTEPGTPHPRRRVEAMAKLNAAGVPSGALVAPVLPGLSDHPDQLREVVRACVDAGARSIHPLLLHLGRGVKEHYLGWLGVTKPELVPLHITSYRGRKRLPDAQRALSELVQGLVEEFGGTPS